MNYKMYKIHHSRGKSDTNFYQEQTLLNGANFEYNFFITKYLSICDLYCCC